MGANPELLDTLPLKPADDTGVTLDGTPLILQEPIVGDRLGPPGAAQVEAVSARLLEYQMTQANWGHIRRDVLAYACACHLENCGVFLHWDRYFPSRARECS